MIKKTGYNLFLNEKELASSRLNTNQVRRLEISLAKEKFIYLSGRKEGLNYYYVQLSFGEENYQLIKEDKIKNDEELIDFMKEIEKKLKSGCSIEIHSRNLCKLI